MEERLQAEWTNHIPDQAEKEQAISKLATQVEEQVRFNIDAIVFPYDKHNNILITASAETSRRKDSRGQGCSHQGMGDQQAQGFGSAEPAPQRTEPQVQSTTGTVETTHGSVERRQNGRERLRRHVVSFATSQRVFVTQSQQYRIHAVSNRLLAHGPRNVYGVELD